MYRIGQEEINAVAKVIESKLLFKINDGLQESMHAEEDLKGIMGCDYALLMTSGHAALVSALTAMGIGPGDEVIVPAYTYIATAMAVVAVGAIPVIVEVDETLTISPVDIEKNITSRTKAILPVHIQAFPCDMDAINAIAKKYNLYVLEDACQSDGGSYKGKRLGTLGTAGAFSFNYFKIISTGEGGALVTNDKEVFERALIYHDSSAVAFFGEQLKDVGSQTFCGNEYRTNEITASILRVQLSRLDGILMDLRKNKKKVMQALASIVKFVPSNDEEGDCGTTLAFRFDSESEARAFAKKVSGVLPIDTGKHVYKNWSSIIEKRGALHPAMDPFKMEANKDCNHNYSVDMCPKTLDLLSRTVYLSVNPDATDCELDAFIESIKNALKK